MLSKIAKFGFCVAQPSAKGGFNVLGTVNRLKTFLRTPIRHIKRGLEPQGVNYSPWTNTTEEAFDEVSQEWQALIVGNNYDVNTFNTLEAVQTANFGTVDNPQVIFSSDAPYRFVGCTGQSNEDDYEGHELLYFMIREGPLQRCPSCGCVFKLVRLRNEMSAEMDYYTSNFHPYEMVEMGEMDTTMQMNPLKINVAYEHTQFETPSNIVYSLINPDDHDRMFVDPAFRLERTKQLEDQLKVYLYTLKEVEQEFLQNFGPMPRYPLNKVEYETLIEVEKAVMLLDRQFNKVSRFLNRKYLDIDNHKRREARMLEKKSQRWDSNYSFFYGGLTEEEQQYRDYFQTDLEKDPQDEIQERKLDETEIFLRGDYNFDKYDFQEGHTRAPEDDLSSLIEKKAFKFKYRMAKDTLDTFQRRNQRMIDRQSKRMAQSDKKDVYTQLVNSITTGNKTASISLEKQWVDLVQQESVQLYKDYFESDAEEDFKLLDNLSVQEKTYFMNNFENFTIPKVNNDGYKLIPKRQWNLTLGFWQNFLLEFNEFSSIIYPQAQLLANKTKEQDLLLLTQKELSEMGLLENKN